jgi:hypothetical protein
VRRVCSRCGCRWLVRVVGAAGCCRWLVRVVAAGGWCRWLVRVVAAGGWCRCWCRGWCRRTVHIGSGTAGHRRKPSGVRLIAGAVSSGDARLGLDGLRERWPGSMYVPRRSGKAVPVRVAPQVPVRVRVVPQDAADSGGLASPSPGAVLPQVPSRCGSPRKTRSLCG